MSIRLNKALRELNIGLQTAVEFLEKKSELGEVKSDLSFKLNDQQYQALVEAFKQDAAVRTEAEKLFQKKPKEKKRTAETKETRAEDLLKATPKQVYTPKGKIDLDSVGKKPAAKKAVAPEEKEEEKVEVAGVKGNRVHGIVHELCNENIDVVNYTTNVQLFIQRALSPARISSINVNEEEHKAEVYLHPEEVSLAIGRGGMNIKLASMLTEYTIDVFREVPEDQVDEDIYLDEFSDEIDQWVIDAIKSIGLDTAKAVLNAPREMLVEKADLEEETVDQVLNVLRAEFEQ